MLDLIIGDSFGDGLKSANSTLTVHLDGHPAHTADRSRISTTSSDTNFWAGGDAIRELENNYLGGKMRKLLVAIPIWFSVSMVVIWRVLIRFLKDPKGVLIFAVIAGSLWLFDLTGRITRLVDTTVGWAVCGDYPDALVADRIVREDDSAALVGWKSICLDPASITADGETTALQLAVEKDSEKVLELFLNEQLFRANADLLIPYDVGNLLHLAANACAVSAVGVILSDAPELASVPNIEGEVASVLMAKRCSPGGDVDVAVDRLFEAASSSANGSATGILRSMQRAVTEAKYESGNRIAALSNLAQQYMRLAGTSPLARSSDGTTLLMLAAETAPAEVVSDIATALPDQLAIRDTTGRTALERAVAAQNWEAAATLIRLGVPLWDAGGGRDWTYQDENVLPREVRNAVLQIDLEIVAAFEAGNISEIERLARRGGHPESLLLPSKDQTLGTVLYDLGSSGVTGSMIEARLSALARGLIASGASLELAYSFSGVIYKSLGEDLPIVLSLFRQGFRPKRPDWFIDRLFDDVVVSADYRDSLQIPWPRAVIGMYLADDWKFPPLEAPGSSTGSAIESVVTAIIFGEDSPNSQSGIDAFLELFASHLSDESASSPQWYGAVLNWGSNPSYSTDAEEAARIMVFNWIERRFGLPTTGSGYLDSFGAQRNPVLFARLVSGLRTDLESESGAYLSLMTDSWSSDRSPIERLRGIQVILKAGVPVDERLAPMAFAMFFRLPPGNPERVLAEWLIENGVVRFEESKLAEQILEASEEDRNRFEGSRVSEPCDGAHFSLNTDADWVLKLRYNDFPGGFGNWGYLRTDLIAPLDRMTWEFFESGHVPTDWTLFLCGYSRSWRYGPVPMGDDLVLRTVDRNWFGGVVPPVASLLDAMREFRVPLDRRRTPMQDIGGDVRSAEVWIALSDSVHSAHGLTAAEIAGAVDLVEQMELFDGEKAELRDHLMALVPVE